jgi:XTP/dITP diphosphohydrolase
LPDIDETGADFAENALLKAQIVASATGKPALGDDSGFCVPALGDFPGLYSARFVKNSGGQDAAVADLWQQVGQKSTPAFYVCYLCLVWPNVCQITAVGRIDGKLVYPARGNQGFGYDPYFVPDGYDQTFAELGPDITQKIGHRALAINSLAKQLGWV